MLAAVAAIGCVAWFAQAGLLFRHLSRLRTISDLQPRTPDSWPSVSAIIPSRDEERSITGALRSRLADDYPDLRLVVVDDRSTDSTPRLIEALAREDERIVSLRIDELPQGWLGKVHALDRGVEAARGEWLLISDADVHMAPGGLRKAVAYCEDEGLDFLALVPEFRSESFIVNVLWTVFMRTLGTFVDPGAVRDPRSKVAMGSGAFMLARRSTFDRTPGYEHLRLDTTDDISLGVMMKAAGARCDFANGRGIARISIYGSLREFFRGVEKNAGSLVRAPFAAVAGVLVVAGFFELSPFLALASGVTWARWLGIAAASAATAAALAALWRNTRMVLPALLWPIGWLLVSAGILRAAWLLHRRGGIAWRETFYTREQLLEGQKFRML